MKRSQITLLTIFIVISAALYIQLSMNYTKKDKSLKEKQEEIFVPVQEVRNTTTELKTTSYGMILPNTEIVVSFEVQGVLQKGDIVLKPGTNFRKGQVLYTVDYQETLHSLNARKMSFSNLLINILPDLEMDFPNDADKWKAFLDGVQANKSLPSLPTIESEKEKLFLTGRTILTEYYNIKSLEVRLEKYRFIAPFNGTVTSIFAEPGSIVNPGGQVAKIAKAGEFEVKVPIAIDDLALFKEKSTALFLDADGNEVATGKILRISNVINQQTQSADVYYSVNPIEGQLIYHGMYLNVSINKKSFKETMALPRIAVKNNRVNVLKNNKIQPVDVRIVSSVPDTVYVTGLRNKQLVILEQVEKIDTSVVYKPVIR